MMKYEFSKAGASLALRDLRNLVNGNAKFIAEYEMILRALYAAETKTKSRVKAKKLRAAYNKLSEQKTVQTGANTFECTWYLPRKATVAQNKAKVLQGRAMMKQFGLQK